MPDETPAAETPAPARNWARLALIAAAAVVVAVVLVVIVRVAVTTPHPALGPTAARELQEGSCLAEGAVDLEQYTVVDCSSPHPQQVFATVDLRVDSDIYTDFATMRSYVDEICARYLEYGLWVKAGIKNDVHAAASIAMPTQQLFDAGETTALCAISSADGSDLQDDLYQRMP